MAESDLVARTRQLLAEADTPPPWKASGRHLVRNGCVIGKLDELGDAWFAAEAVNAIPALLADNEDKRQESATYKAMAVKAEQEAQRHFDRAAASEADNERLTAENANLRESAETAVFVANANTESLRIWQERYETLSLHHSAEAARADAAEARLTQAVEDHERLLMVKAAVEALITNDGSENFTSQAQLRAAVAVSPQTHVLLPLPLERWVDPSEAIRERVRAIHSRNSHFPYYCTSCRSEYPCRTVKALATPAASVVSETGDTG